jgi:hypothetical protein
MQPEGTLQLYFASRDGSVVPVTGVERPPPPESLTGEGRDVWIDITERMPAHWLLTSLPLLECYARSVAFEHELANALGTVAAGSKAHVELARAWRAQVALIASLATKLLSPRSRHDRYAVPQADAARLSAVADRSRRSGVGAF